MSKIIQIAWRNLWRNKRRTLITASSIFFAVFFAIFMRSFQLGTYGYMIEQSIESYTGYLQVQNPEYFDDPGIDNSFAASQELIDQIKTHDNVSAVAPRIETFALASTGTKSKGVMVSGIDTKAEQEVSNPEHRLVRYRLSKKALNKMEQSKKVPEDLMDRIENFRGQSFSSKARIELDLDLSEDEIKNYMPLIEEHSSFTSNYLTANDQGIIISDRLSKYLEASVGDSVVLIGQGYHGVSAAGVYPVRGIIKMASPDLDNKLIYMTTEMASQFLGLYNKVTSLVINLHDNNEMKETQAELMEDIGNEQHTVKNWEEIVPTLKQQIESDNVGGQIFVGILYFIVFFGIFGTVVMMIAERKREFGVMVALGMKRKKLASIVSIEMFFIGLLGTFAGMLATVPLLLYGHYNPIRLTGEIAKMYEDMGFDPLMPLALFDSYFFYQGLVIVIMILVASLVPLNSIRKLNVIRAIRG